MVDDTRDLESGRRAAREGAWREALHRFSTVDQATLTPQDLDLVADCHWWLLELDESMAARQKAYAGYVAHGDDARAGYAAWFLAYDHLSKGETSLAAGWLRRARGHLDKRPACREHGYLEIADTHAAEARGDLAAAAAHARATIATGQRFSDADLIGLGTQNLGRALIAMGEVARGVELLDEAMTSVIAGELTPFATGWVYCNVLIACLDIGDLGRAGEWTEAARAWCASLPATTPYHGLCRVYRVEVVALRGAWAEAESEARRATEELTAFVPAAASAAYYQIGEVRRRRGDLAGAEEAFSRAHELGSDVQPGLALVRLAQGNVDAAHAALRVALGQHTRTDARRVRLLAAHVEVAVAAGALDVATRACDELEAIAATLPNPATHAAAATARGTLQLASGDPELALHTLHDAWTLWQTLKLPYEAANARTVMGIAARRAGDDDRAKLELRAARTAFEQLAATLDADRVARLLGDHRRLPAGLSNREAEVLRLIAAGKTNREIGDELFISEHTVARHVSNIFGKLGVTSRAGATAYAFEHSIVR